MEVVMKNYTNPFQIITLLFVFMVMVSCDSGITSTNHAEKTNIENSNLNQSKTDGNYSLLMTCPNVSSSDFSTIDFFHKVRIEYNDAGTYPVVSWESNNPQTTTLDYDGGDWAYFVNNGYGYLEIKLTVSGSGGTNCTSYHLVYY